MNDKLLDLINDIWSKSDFPSEKFSGYTHCHGGSINDVLLLQGKQLKVIVKINDKSKLPEMFRMEADGLMALKQPGAPRVPEVLGVREVKENQFLFLEYLEPVSPVRNRDAVLGNELASLHRRTSDAFGWKSSNYIGSLQQQNGTETNAIDFFIHQRLMPQTELAVQNGFTRLKVEMEKFYKLLPELLPLESPSLIHGDLWSGNRITGPDGRWALIDPAVSYGSREADLAMTFMFGSFGNDFLTAYNSAFPITPGFEARVQIWNLYPLLVHLNLFGSSYLAPIQNILNKYQ